MAATAAPRVLVVDDEPSVVDIVRAVLESEGMHVEVADSAESALALLDTIEVDAVVTDICMGEMSGFDLAERLHASKPLLRVIAMTAHDSYDMVKSALDAGMHGYLQKPLLDHDALSLQVRRACDATRMERMNASLLKRLRSSLSRIASMNEALESQNRELERIAISDALTGLYNRAHMDTLARAALARASSERTPLSLLQLEIDHFKAINDAFGHAVGDESLKRCAELLGDALRSAAADGASLGRLGGTEFLVVLENADADRARAVGERLRRALATLTVGGTRDMIRATASIGATSFTPTAHPADADADAMMHRLFREADRALASAKAGGRDRVHHHACAPRTDDDDAVTPDEPSDDDSLAARDDAQRAA